MRPREGLPSRALPPGLRGAVAGRRARCRERVPESPDLRTRTTRRALPPDSGRFGRSSLEGGDPIDPPPRVIHGATPGVAHNLLHTRDKRRTLRVQCREEADGPLAAPRSEERRQGPGVFHAREGGKAMKVSFVPVAAALAAFALGVTSAPAAEGEAAG